ncbi:hypothetical protein HZA26_02735 [Candidatus Nomurabacteria bacterium]|nr:hypothetical protein [Candidatus Nomurabacteria bacterium]
MNRKILMSLGAIVFVAALVATATGAFFSDSETSTGNTFTAGAIDLKVDSVQHYNGLVCVSDGEIYVWAPEENVTLDVNNQPVLGAHDFDAYNLAHPGGYPVAGSSCDGTWTLTDLTNSLHKFWNFTDVKPGDEGENTISLHIDNNPAWACVDVNLTANDDVTCNDPENDAEGPAVCNNSVPSATFDGELAQNLKFAAWADDGDNVWETGEPLLFSNQSGPASDVLGGKTYALADSVTGPGPLPGGSTSYIGLAWCAGTQTVDTGANTISCDGAGMGNDTQTDSMTADVAFRVEQHRNNPNFLCTPRTAPETGTVTVDKVVTFTSTSVVGVDVNDFTLHIDGPVPGTGDDQVVVDEVPTAGLPVGQYTVSEVYSNDPVGIQFNASFSGSCTEVGDTGVANMTVVAGVNPTCTITNLVITPQT